MKVISSTRVYRGKAFMLSFRPDPELTKWDLRKRIAVVVDPAAPTHPVEDGAIATQNMLLAAHALGLGTCWIGSYGSSYEERVKEILGIPEGKRLLSIISVGYPAESPRSRRAELGELVFSDYYGGK